MEMKDQVAIITGAGQGIGRATALAMAKAGAAVACVDINGEAAKAVAAEAGKLGGRTFSVSADLGDVKEIDRMVGEIVTAFGRVDCLVNNAGVTRKAYIMDLTEADWDHIHRVNAKGVFFVITHPSPSAVQAEAVPVSAARTAWMASSGPRPLRRPVATTERMSA